MTQAKGQKANRNGNATILIAGHLAAVQVGGTNNAAIDTDKLLAGILSPSYPHFFTADSGEIHWRWQSEAYFVRLDDDGEDELYEIPSGVVPYLRQQLLRRGFGVQVIDETDAEAVAVPQFVRDSDSYTEPLLRVLCQHGRGQLMVGNISEAVYLIGRPLSNFPSCRPILFTATNDAKNYGSRPSSAA